MLQKLLRKIFKIFQTQQKKNKSDLYLVVFPWPETLIYGQSEFNWEKFANSLCIENRCKELINFFDDFETIKENNQNWKNLIYIDDDVHFKKFGNEIIASKILEKLKN